MRNFFTPSRRDGVDNDLLKISDGGTGQVTPLNALVALDGVPNASVNLPNGIASLDSQKKLSPNVLEGIAITGLSVDGPLSLATSATGTYTITDYDTFTNYVVALLPGNGGGSVSRTGDTITYIAPGSAVPGGFSLNGKVVSVAIGTPIPNAPVVSSPIMSADNVLASFLASASAFSTSSSSNTHLSSDWQVATDSAFTAIVFQSMDDTTNKTSITVTGLLKDTNYFFRVRYKGNSFGNGNWSSVISFKTRASFVPSVEVAKLVATDKAANDFFGYSLDAAYDAGRIVVGAYSADTDGSANTGAVYVFLKTGSAWAQEAKIVASDKTDNDQFGYSVCMSAAGDRIAVGSLTADVTSIVNSGATYVYVRSGTTWSEEAKLTASDKADKDYFGCSVSMSGDGTRVAIGAYNDSSLDDTTREGSAYVFSRSGSVWTQEAKLSASDKANGDRFGFRVYMGVSGVRVIVGAYSATIGGLQSCGAAYVYSRSGVAWSQEAKLSASDKAANAEFGVTVSMTADGARTVIGAQKAGTTTLSLSGAVYVFSRSGTTWTEEAILVPTSRSNNDFFGCSVSIDNDGNRIVVGSNRDSIEDNQNEGSAYTFIRNGTTWTQSSQLIAGDKFIDDNFGSKSLISGDGNIVVIGAKSADPGGITDAGAVYIFS